MIIYDDISKIDNKQCVNLSAIFDKKILQLGHGKNGYVTFLSGENHSWGLMDLSGKIVVEPMYKGLRIKDGKYCAFLNSKQSDNNMYPNNNFGILSIKDDKELIEAKFRHLDIINGRLFGSLQEPGNGVAPYYQEFSLKPGDELGKEIGNKYGKQVKGKNGSLKQFLVYNGLPINPDYNVYLEDFSKGAHYVIYKDMGDGEEEIFLEIPVEEISEGGVIQGNDYNQCIVLDNGVTLLIPEDEDYIVGLNSGGKHLFTTNSSDFINKGVNSGSVTQSLSIDGKILFFSKTSQTFEIIDTDKFLKEMDNLGGGFYSIGNDKYYGKISKEDYNGLTNITDVCKKLTLCENSGIDNVKINGKFFKKKLLKLN